MAKKYESDIDPDEFIRSFREEPSGLSSFKRSTTETKNSDAQSVTDSVKTQEESTPASTAVSDAAINDYRSRFISDNTYLRPRPQDYRRPRSQERGTGRRGNNSDKYACAVSTTNQYPP